MSGNIGTVAAQFLFWDTFFEFFVLFLCSVLTKPLMMLSRQLLLQQGIRCFSIGSLILQAFFAATLTGSIALLMAVPALLDTLLLSNGISCSLRYFAAPLTTSAAPLTAFAAPLPGRNSNRIKKLCS
jgi:hypothetical protein